MRVISGIAKGRKLYAPKGLKTRPTSDRVKEAIFSILGDKANGAKVLDLFAGAGTLGIEALSRGAKKAVFVDNNKKALEAAKKNFKACGFDENAEFFEENSFIFLKKLKEEAQTFDLIFADPPYKIEPDLLTVLVKQAIGLLRPKAFFLLEHSKRVKVSCCRACLFKEKTYGDTVISIYRKGK